MATLDITSWAHQNLALSRAGELVVRDAVYEDRHVDAIAADEALVAGFSVRSPNTGEVGHYLFTRDHKTGEGTLHVLDEEFQALQTLGVGTIPPRLVVTHATLVSPHVSSLELLIGGDDIPTLYGFVGGGVIVAEAQEDEDPNTTVLEVPRGIVAGFAGRAVVASGKNLYFSSPYGTAVVDGEARFTGPRTYHAFNIGDMASVIYGLHVTDQGALLVVTDTGVWGLPPAAVAQGLMVRNLFERVSGYGASGHQQTALSRSTLYGLSDLGLVRASSPALEEVALDEPRHPHTLSTPIEVPDYRACRVWPWERGAVVSQPHALCVVDDVRGHRSWQVLPPGEDWTVVGVLTHRDGSTSYISPGRVWSFYGQRPDLDTTPVVGVACGGLREVMRLPPQASLVLREVTTSSDTPGAQMCSARGSSPRVKETPQAGAVIGRDRWSATEPYGERAVRSRRHRFAIRTDDPTLEVAAQHAGSRLGLVDAEFRGQGRRRP